MKSYVYVLCALGAIGVFLIVDPPAMLRVYSQTVLYDAPLILMAALCFGAALALGMPSKNASTPKTKPVTMPVEPATTVDKRSSIEDKRGKGRPKSACELARKGLIQCPLVDVEPEIPDSVINLIADKVTDPIADKVSQKVALRMLAAIDPQRAQAIQEERKKASPPQPEPQAEPEEKKQPEKKPQKSEELVVDALAEIAQEVTPT